MINKAIVSDRKTASQREFVSATRPIYSFTEPASALVQHYYIFMFARAIEQQERKNAG